MRKKIIPVILVIIVLGIITYFVYDFLKDKLSINENIIEASGVIEVTTVMLGSNSAGKLIHADLNEGDKVNKGDVVASQDTGILEKQIQITSANIEAAKTQIDAAVLQYNQAVELAEENLDQAYIMKEYMATYNHFVYYDEPLSITKGESETSSTLDSTYGFTTIQGATTTSNISDSSGYSTSTSLTYAGSAQKKSVQMQLEDAVNKYKLAKLKLKQVQENDIQIKIAEKNLDTVKAQLDLYCEQLEQLKIISPINGIVLNKLSEAGEYLLPGTQIYEIGDLYNVTCNIYIPEDKYGKVFLDQKVTLMVDSYPEEEFYGHITKVSDKAEFTPKNIQTKEDRVITVYKITISIKNPELKLKPGMPADVVIDIKQV
jgi:HlyD family secretion protein